MCLVDSRETCRGLEACQGCRAVSQFRAVSQSFHVLQRGVVKRQRRPSSKCRSPPSGEISILLLGTLTSKVVPSTTHRILHVSSVVLCRGQKHRHVSI